MILCLTLAQISVLLVALDVSNQGGNPTCNRLEDYSFPTGSNSTANHTDVTFAPSLARNLSTPSLQPTTVVSPSASPQTIGRRVLAIDDRLVRELQQDNSTNITSPAPTSLTPTPASIFTVQCGSLDIAKMWEAMFYLFAIFVAVIIPFVIFFYESGDGDNRRVMERVCEAVSYQGVALVLVGLALGLMYGLINTYSYPVVNIDVGISYQTVSCLEVDACVAGSSSIFDPKANVIIDKSRILPLEQTTGQNNGSFISFVPSTFGVYLGGFTSFIGWFLFAMYTGVGLITLPVDLIRAFRYRPKYISKDVYLRLRDEIKCKVDDLLKVGLELQEDRRSFDSRYKKLSLRERFTRGRKQKQLLIEFKANVEQVEADFHDIHQCHAAWKSYNPLIPYMKLVLGIIAIILSLCWYLHMFIFVLPYFWPTGRAPLVPTFFLNDMITWGLLNSGFALIGVFLLALFGLYLFICNLSGNIKLGLRFLIVEVYPMKVNGTYMNAFLVNCLLLLLQAPALLSFLAQSLVNTLANTDLDTIMNISIRYTTFFVYFFDYNAFVFFLLACSLLTIIFVYCCASDQIRRSSERLKEKVNKLKQEIVDEANRVEREAQEATRPFKSSYGIANLTARGRRAMNMDDGV